MPDDTPTPQRQQHWRYNLRLTMALLLVWALVTFGGTFYAHRLTFEIFGWPFHFWLAAQGALLLYCAIVAVYAGCMNRADRRYRANATRPTAD